MNCQKTLPRLLVGALLTVGLFACYVCDQANANFLIRISDGVTTNTIADNQFGDLDFVLLGERTDGVVAVSSSFGWGDVTFSTGISKPAIGGAATPKIHLSSFRLSTLLPGPRDVSIEVTDTDFVGAPGGLDPAHFRSSIGGVTGGAVEFATWVDSSNAEFGKGEQLGPAYSFSNTGSVAFSGSTHASTGTTAPFSLTLQAIVSHDSATVTSFDAELQAVPEPASWMAWLAMIPMVGLAVWRKRHAG